MRELFLSQLFSPHDTIKPLFEPRQPFEMNSRFFSTSWIFHFQRTLASLHVFPLEFIFLLTSSSNTFKAILLPRVKHFPLLSLFTQLSAVISIPLWQWFLQRFGKKTAAFCGITVSTLFLFWLADTDGYTLMFVPSCGQSHECSVPVWVTEAHLNVVLRFYVFMALSPPSSGSCRSPWCWSSSPTLWWPTSWLSPLGSAWPLRSCCRGKMMRGSITSSSLSLLSCQNCHIFTKDKEKTNTSNA